jgi:hypothetical protein
MNTSAVDIVVIELSEQPQPADIMHAWAERSPDGD